MSVLRAHGLQTPSTPWIVVVNWNGASLLPACLAALGALDTRPRVLVVDNGSTDSSREVAAGFEGVEWVSLEGNQGFAQACNVGLRRALDSGARWIGTVNTDVCVEPEWLCRLVEAGETHPHVGILGGLLVFEDEPGRVNSTGLVLDPLWRARDRDFGAPLHALKTCDGPVVAVSGAAALFRAEALRRAGLFDPEYSAYCEDLDLCLRAARLGIGAWFVSGARASHGYGRSFGADSPLQRYLLARNHLRILATHAPWPLAAMAVPLLALLRAALRAPLEILRGRPDLAVAHWRAARDGLGAALAGARRRLAPGREGP